MTLPNGPLSAAKTVIIGDCGRMGAMLKNKVAAAGLNVCGTDVPFADIEDKCSCASLALLCVPARHLESVIRKTVPHLEENAILADITSVKELPMRLMEKHWPGAVVGTHPLFGPQNQPGDDLPVTIVPGKKATAKDVELVSAFFTTIGCRVFESTASVHDQAMARIQNMNFITTLAYFAVLAGQEDLLPFITPSFLRRKNAAEKMLTEDAEMFSGLFDANGHSHEAVRQYRKMLNIAASGDIELLCEKARWWWQETKK